MSRSYDITTYHSRGYKLCKRIANRRVRRLIALGLKLGIDLIPNGTLYKRVYPLCLERDVSFAPKRRRAIEDFCKLSKFKRHVIKK